MKQVPSELYDENYYLNLAGGGTLFSETQGAEVDPRAARLLTLIDFTSATEVLDVGCGRGELLKALCNGGVRLAVGVDYSQASMRLAHQILGTEIEAGQCCIHNADAARLPYRTSSFDYVLMADIVEHLYPLQLSTCLAECKRVLKESGCVLIHTFPNKLCWDFGYPILRSATNLWRRERDGKLPRNPRTDYDPVLHVNEQTPRKLKRALVDAGFKSTRVWLEFSSITPYLHFLVRGGNRKRELLFKFISLPALRSFFYNDIYAIAFK
jgi:ubiquinone/menaquinone biosynthesis C-methylase UbiE